MPRRGRQTTASQDIEVAGQVFKYVGSKAVDDKYRVSLGSKIAKFLRKIASPRSMDIFLSSEGYILLRPMARIPASEAWPGSGVTRRSGPVSPGHWVRPAVVRPHQLMTWKIFWKISSERPVGCSPWNSLRRALRSSRG